uniref:Reverse transcriptase domain-containing protein n=1 Tax=Dendroctonus ponderosae TaxID=77166 RepID=A0AAR5QHZ6_DENPD
MDFRGVPPMPMSGNLCENWRFWKQRFQTYLLATEISKKEEVTQCAQLLTLIGEEGMRMFNTFDFAEEEKGKIDILIQKFDNHFNPKKNFTYERYKFLTYKQTEYQTMEKYITELKNLSLSCEFENLRESLVKDVLICGIKSEKLREKLLQEDVDSLAHAVKICLTSESIKEKNREISSRTSPMGESRPAQVDQMNKWQGRRQEDSYRSKEKIPNNQAQQLTRCQKCSYSHVRGKCPAYGKVCLNCNKSNHFAKCCKIKRHNNASNVHTISRVANSRGDTIDTADNFAFVDSVHLLANLGTCESNEEAWFITMTVNGHPVEVKLDTGAMANVIPEHVLKAVRFNFCNIKPTKVKLSSYNNTMIPLVGECILNCEYNDKVDNISFYVTKNRSCTVLGLKSCLDLKLIKRINEVTENNKIDNLLSKHERLFRGIGCVKKPYSIKLKENAIPVAFPARKVPFAIQEKLKDTLDSLEKQKIIMKDMDSAEWVHPLVIVRKSNGTLRICLDPKDLNRSLKRHYFKLPTLDELTEDLAGATYFSTLDCTQGFLQIPLDRESSKICTFSTIFGRYRFNVSEKR